MNKQSTLIKNAFLAQSTLTSFVKHIEKDITQKESPKNGWQFGRLDTGILSLDKILKIPKGACVEISSSNPSESIRFALKLCKNSQKNEGISLFLDPFGEFRDASFNATNLDRDLTIISNHDDPYVLAKSATSLMEKLALSTIFIPPGVIENRFISGRKNTSSRNLENSEKAFLKTLAVLVWYGWKYGTSIVILRKISDRKYSRSLGWSQFRFRIQSNNHGRTRRKLLIEQDVMNPETVGTCIDI